MTCQTSLGAAREVVLAGLDSGAGHSPGAVAGGAFVVGLPDVEMLGDGEEAVEARGCEHILVSENEGPPHKPPRSLT